MRWILIGYMFLFIHRPFEVWPALGEFHVERVYMLGALLVLPFASGKRWLPNWQHYAYIGFAGAVLVCWLSSRWMDHGQPAIEDWFKILVFYFLLVLVVSDERSLRLVLLGFLVIMALYMTHSLREYLGGRHTFRMGIARMIGVDRALGDPNSFGASIVYALPFVVPFWVTKPSRLLRCFLIFYITLSFVCIGLTGSRSSLIGLLLCMFIVIMRSRWRVSLMLLALFSAPLMWAALPASLQNRFETIINPEVGPTSAIESGQDRLDGIFIGLELWERYPLTGCGPGAWRPATQRSVESHNLYGQTVGEMGTLGAISFAVVLLGFWWNLRRIKKLYKNHPEWGQDFLFHVSRALGLAVFLLLFEGSFGHNLFRYSWLWYGGFLIIARYCVEQRAQVSDLAASLGWAEESYAEQAA